MGGFGLFGICRAFRAALILTLAASMALSPAIIPSIASEAGGVDVSFDKLSRMTVADEPATDRNGLVKLPDHSGAGSKRDLFTRFDKSPLRFEANRGQADPRVRFISRGRGYTLYLTSSEALLALTDSTAKLNSIRLRTVGGSSPSGISGRERLSTRTNYFIGNDPKEWHVDVPNYARVEYRDVYPGIDQVFYGNQGQLEYDFIVSPGADPGRIRVAFDGAKGLRREASGDLTVQLPEGELRQQRPIAYQEVNGHRREIRCGYVIENGREVRFEIGEYDKTRALTIDPVLAYSTFLGGSRLDEGNGIAVDAAGNAYIAGITESSDFPITDSMTPGISITAKALVIKLNATGTGAPEYVTLIGGHFNNWAQAIAVDAAGSAYLTGVARSSSFPVHPAGSVAQSVHGGNDDAFVLKLNPEGNRLVYSTFLGGRGSDRGNGIAVDAFGNAYVAGDTNSADFPIKNGMFSNLRAGDAFVTKVNPGGTSFIYSTYLGGSGWDVATAVALDARANAYVTGHTNSPDFPSATWIPSRRSGTQEDVFVARVNPAGNGLVYATILSGFRDDRGRAIAVDSRQQVCVTGTTTSTDFPLAGALRKKYGGGQDAFVTRLSASGQALVQSTYLGGSGLDAGNGIALDPADNVYVAGLTWSGDFPTAEPIQPNNRGRGDAFVARFDRTLTRLEYSTFLGGAAHGRTSIFRSTADEALGIAVDSSGAAYITGRAASSDFPTAGPIQGQIRPDLHDLFVAKIHNLSPDSLTITNLTPNHGGDTGWVTVNVHGVGFQTGAAVRLVRSGHPEIAGQPVRIREAGRVILTTFDLRGKARGLWDLVVTNPDGRTATLERSFTVEEGCEAKVIASLVGSPNILRNRKQRYELRYRNLCNTDAVMVPILVVFRGNVTVTRTEPHKPLPPPPDSPPDGDDNDSGSITTTDGETIIDELIDRIPGDTGGSVQIEVSVNDDSESVSGEVHVLPPLLDSGGRVSSTAYDCLSYIFKDVLTDLLEDYAEDKIKGCMGAVYGNIVGEMAGAYFNNPEGSFSIQQLFIRVIRTIIKCMGPLIPQAEVVRLASLAVTKVVRDYIRRIHRLEACLQFLGETFKFVINVVASNDPNEKIGPAGSGEGRYISGNEELSYWIHFENLRSATAPAQEVVITDQLDPAIFDLRTFEFESIAFGERYIRPIRGQSEFVTTVDLRPERPVLVNVRATLDRDTGLVTWRLSSIDPETGEPPNNPSLGFLPPNMNPPEGDGSVSFTVGLRRDGPGEAVIRNVAAITFDRNEPLITPAWVNTLDRVAPSSSVEPLAPAQNSQTFRVNWSGSDGGSGLRDYTVWVSINGGAYAPWLKDASATSADYTGQTGSTYRFYSIARDRAGNIEPRPSMPDATTTIGPAGNPAPQLLSLNPSAVIAGGAAFTLTVSGAGFITDSRIRWDGAERATTFISPNELRAVIPAADIALPGAYSVTVVNPAPGGASSNPLTFTVNPSAPVDSPDEEREPNETSASATPLSLPGRRTGSAAVGDAAHWHLTYDDGSRDGLEDLFALNVTRNSTVDLRLTAENADADIDLFLFREENGSLSFLGFSINGPGEDERIVIGSPLPPGRYLVAVSAYSGASRYTLTSSIGDSARLTLGFNGTLAGADGRPPLISNGVSFSQGVLGSGLSLSSGNQLYYGSAGVFDPEEGSVELWIKPEWNGNDSRHHYIMQYGGGGGLLIGKDSANNLRLILNRYGAAGGAEIDTGVSIADWRAGQWRHLVFTWNNRSKVIGVYVDGALKSSRIFNHQLPVINSDRLQIGGDGQGGYLEAVIDELVIHGVALTPDQIAERHRIR